jgi:hypothetical protein
MTPMLVTDSPYPRHRIVGNLSNTEQILQILGLGAGVAGVRRSGLRLIAY